MRFHKDDMMAKPRANMQPTPQLLDHLYAEKVRAARQMTPEQRVLAAFELTAFVRRGLEDGIRSQHPDASEEQVQRILCERVAKLKRLHERR
jgi:hypothetical protein